MQVTGKQKSVFKDFNRKIYIFFLHKTTFLRETIQCFPLYKLSLFVVSLCTNCLSLFWTLFQICYTRNYILSPFVQIIFLCTNYLPLYKLSPFVFDPTLGVFISYNYRWRSYGSGSFCWLFRFWFFKEIRKVGGKETELK